MQRRPTIEARLQAAPSGHAGDADLVGATAPGAEARAAAPEEARSGSPPYAARIWLNGDEWRVRLCPSDVPDDATPDDAAPAAAPATAPTAVAEEQQAATAAAPLRARILKGAAGAYVVRLRRDGEATSLPGERTDGAAGAVNP